jgi:NADH-quinone oxidoreductase subunit J
VSGEAWTFWIIAPLTVVGGLGLVLSRKAVHSALWLAVTMIGLAVLYIAQDAPFLGVVQVIVYTGAVMMLFLFVIMLVGVDASDSLVETIKGQRVAAVLAGAGLAFVLVAAITRATLPPPVTPDVLAPLGNVESLAALIFTDYVFTFMVTSALLITAAVGALVLTLHPRVAPRRTQRDLAAERFRPVDGDFSMAAGLPAPGVLARHNAIGTPALLPDGTPSELSFSRVLLARESLAEAAELAGEVVPESQVEADTDPDVASSGSHPPTDAAPSGSGTGEAPR